LPYYHMFSHKSHDPGIRLAEKLAAMAPEPLSRVFLTNSGSEANDTAVKLIWYYNNALGRPEKKKIIARQRAYHGVTLASGSLTGLPLNHRDFDLPLPRFLHTDCPHYYRESRPGESGEEFSTRMALRLEQLIQDEGPHTVAAFVAEPVMGAGGVIPPPPGYFEKVQQVLKKHDVLMVADEVITGLGRTGSLWGCQTYGIRPDMLISAKQLSSGYLPIAAVLVSRELDRVLVQQSEKLGLFAHGFTYTGHPVSAAVALRNLELFEERGLLENVRRLAPVFAAGLERLAGHPLVGDARGVGLIGGLELMADRDTRRPYDPEKKAGLKVFERCQENGLIVRAIGDIIALCPPLIITAEQLEEIFRRLEKSLDEAKSLL
ncbi:MAG: aminotransferase, partial [Deltaproteobacteria bacterium]|nr:aminotransferase [Deltaproteobacteria bacterium]